MQKRLTKVQKILFAVTVLLFLLLAWIVIKTPFRVYRSMRDDIADRINSRPYLTREEYLRTLGSADGSPEGLAEVYELTSLVPKEYIRKETTEYEFFADDIRYRILRQVELPERGLCFRSHSIAYDTLPAPTDPDTQEPFRIDQILLTDDTFRFGRWKIGVGSPKWKVRLAHLSDIALDDYNISEYIGDSSDFHLLTADRAEDFSLGYCVGLSETDEPGVMIAYRFNKRNRVDLMVLNFAKGKPRWK